MPDRNTERLRLVADRLAVALVLLKTRHGNDWNPWIQEDLWEGEDGLAEEVRSWAEYKEAMQLVRLFIRRNDGKNEPNTADAA